MGSGLCVEIAVLGLHDALLENRLIALGSSANGECTSRRLMAYSAGKLPKFKIPGEMRLVKTLPKKANGKIDRRECLLLARQDVSDVPSPSLWNRNGPLSLRTQAVSEKKAFLADRWIDK